MAEVSAKDSEGKPSTRKSRNLLRSEEAELGPNEYSVQSTPRSRSREQATPSARASSTSRLSTSEATVADKMPTSTSSKSNSSNASPQPAASQLASAGATTGASPYGTRSRNRANNTRPNYAEDKDNEMDFEYTSTKSSQHSTIPASQPMQRKTSSGSYGRRGTITSTIAKAAALPATAAAAALPKEPIPGTSTFSVHDSQSKKRKAPGSSATVAHTSTTSHPPPSSATRKSSQALSSALSALRENNMVTFENTSAYLTRGYLTADDKTQYKVNDFVYLVCEPPGEPYYLARIMEFVHAGHNPTAHIDSLRINWMYRPRDIGRKQTDTRLVFASMHSDTCPLTSLRGKCEIKHQVQIHDLDEYRKQKDSFYFSQMYDRYIHRYYDVIATSKVINVPENVKKVLDERWQFIIVELGRGKDFTSAVKTCKRCSGYCANDNSVDCAMCKTTYHMNCVQPPLQKKPARGFAWSCGPCSRKQERKLEARNTPLMGGDGDEEEFFDEDEEVGPTNGNSPNAEATNEVRAATKDQIAQAKMWPYRYLGIHCKPSDALDYDDRIYPRASSRLGSRHQAVIPQWPGRPFEYVKHVESRRKYTKGATTKKDAKLSKDTLTALETEKRNKERRPKWVVDEPIGYEHRGEDPTPEDPTKTSKLLFKLPTVGERSSRGGDETDLPQVGDRDKVIDDYMRKAKRIAGSLNLPTYHTNFLDKAIQLLHSNDFKADVALKQLQEISVRKDLKEPKLNKEELKRFEDAVARYGSNLGDVSRHVGAPKHGDIVRFYYTWKKTDKGKQIWSNYEGRKGKKATKNADGPLLDDVADDFDDSAFDNEKASKKKRGFICKFCSTRESRFWRRAPATAAGSTVPVDGSSRRDKGHHLMVALCQRCATLWRKYAIRWENIDEVAKKITQSGGRAFKRKMDEELLRELVHANEANQVSMSATTVSAAQALGMDVPSSLTITSEQDAARKKQKVGTTQEKKITPPPAPVEPPKKKPEKPPEPPPLVPEQPKWRKLVCAICRQIDLPGDERFSCRHCKLTVHRHCFGIPESRSPNKWTCETCSNDSSNQYSTNYSCILCPMSYREERLFEEPKASHKKKTDREREKERLEKELYYEAMENYRKTQEDLGRPDLPREALKPTASNHWMHVVCGIWNPWIKFRDAQLMNQPEGMVSIPTTKYNETCRICHLKQGVCIQCPKCPALFHATCAQDYNYPMGFYVTPVKGSRKDVINSVTFGEEIGHVEAVIYCSHHDAKSTIHSMTEVVSEDGLTALQSFVQNFKQADSSLTGTVRKAAMINLGQPNGQAKEATNGHRGSVSNGSGANPSAGTRSSRASPAPITIKSEEIDEQGDRVVRIESVPSTDKKPKNCASCRGTASPKWYKQVEREQVNGHTDPQGLGIANGNSPQYFCHRCEMKRRKTASPMPPTEIHSHPLPYEASPVATPAQQTPPWPATTPLYRPPPGHSQAPPPQGPPASVPSPIVNGAIHTPPPHALPPQPHSPYAAPAPSYYPNGVDRREVPPPSSIAPAYPPPNAVPPAHYMSRRPSEPLAPAAHPHAHGPPQSPYHGSPQFAPPIVNGARSPPNSGYSVTPGAAGPLRPADDPFYESPRRQYLGPPMESPRQRVGEIRPQTPGTLSSRPTPSGGDSQRERERTEPLSINGASASPSLKNLLH